MDFAWTDAQLAFKKEIISFAQKELNRNLVERDETGAFSPELWRKCAEFGIQGLAIPAEYGGRGLDIMTSVLAMEGLGYGCRDNGLTLALNGQMWTVQHSLVQFGSEQLKQSYLPDLCHGRTLAAYAITEPDAGSDVYAMSTFARRHEDGYILNGTKSFISMVPLADLALVFATIDASLGMWGICCFLVERSSPGCSFESVGHKMGLRTVPMGKVTLKDCFVPRRNRLGAERAGASILNAAVELERSCVLATHLGVMERQLEETITYARRRHQFNQPIGKFQSVSNRIAEMKVSLEAARLLVYKVAWLKQMGRSAALEAALAKLYLTESFVRSSMDAIRVHGGRGYLTENEIERDLRDAIGSVLYGGTSDIQRAFIARHLGL